MKLKKIISCGIILSMIAGCDTAGSGNNSFTSLFSKTNVGTVAGGVGGAAVGSQIGKGTGNIVAIAAGTLLGAALGRSIGSSLDKADLNAYNQTSQNAMENGKTGTTSTWSNPDTGRSGSVTPTRTFQNSSGQYCREYTQTVNIDGKTEQAYGTACRDQDGNWKIVEE